MSHSLMWCILDNFSGTDTSNFAFLKIILKHENIRLINKIIIWVMNLKCSKPNITLSLFNSFIFRMTPWGSFHLLHNCLWVEIYPRTRQTNENIWIPPFLLEIEFGNGPFQKFSYQRTQITKNVEQATWNEYIWIIL